MRMVPIIKARIEGAPRLQENISRIKRGCSRAPHILGGEFGRPSCFNGIMITAKIGDFVIERILIDRNASHNALFTNVLSKMALNWNGRVFSTNKTAYFNGESETDML